MIKMNELMKYFKMCKIVMLLRLYAAFKRGLYVAVHISKSNIVNIYNDHVHLI